MLFRSNDLQDFYNFLLDSENDPLSTVAVASSKKLQISEKLTMKKRYSMYLSSKASSSGSLDDLMNGIIKEKLQIIPKNLRCGVTLSNY